MLVKDKAEVWQWQQTLHYFAWHCLLLQISLRKNTGRCQILAHMRVYTSLPPCFILMACGIVHMQVHRLYRDGALPQADCHGETPWVTTELGSCPGKDNGMRDGYVVARMREMWVRLAGMVATQTSSGMIVTHADLFRSALPMVHSYYTTLQANPDDPFVGDAPEACTDPRTHPRIHPHIRPRTPDSAIGSTDGRSIASAVSTVHAQPPHVSPGQAPGMDAHHPTSATAACPRHAPFMTTLHWLYLQERHAQDATDPQPMYLEVNALFEESAGSLWGSLSTWYMSGAPCPASALGVAPRFAWSAGESKVALALTMLDAVPLQHVHAPAVAALVTSVVRELFVASLGRLRFTAGTTVRVLQGAADTTRGNCRSHADDGALPTPSDTLVVDGTVCVLPPTWCSDPSLPFLMLDAGTVDRVVLEAIRPVFRANVQHQNMFLPEFAVQTTVDRILGATTDAATAAALATLEAHLAWLVHCGLPVEHYTVESPLTRVARVFCATSERALLRVLLVLCTHGAHKLSSTVHMAQLLHTAHVRVQAAAAAPTDHAAATGGADTTWEAAVLVSLAPLVARNQSLRWELSWVDAFDVAATADAAHLRAETHGYCRMTPHTMARVCTDGVVREYSSSTGRRLVARLPCAVGDALFLKFRPELPGLEYAVRILARILFPDTLIAPFVELCRWTFNTATGADKVRNVQDDDPVLVSQGVEGRSLLDVVRAHDTTVLHHLDAKALSEALVLAMVTMPEDGKPDNYICEPVAAAPDDDGGARTRGRGRFRLVCVDNDHSFVPAVARDATGRNANLRVKCILFCMDQMHHPVHASVRDALSSATFDVLQSLSQWIKCLEAASHTMYTTFADVATEATQRAWSSAPQPSVIGVPIPPNTVSALTHKLRRIQRFLSKHSQCTHMDLLREVEPLLFVRYRDASTIGANLWERFKYIDGAGFDMVNDMQCTMFGTKQLASVLFAVPVTKNILELILTGMACSPLQAWGELQQLQREWAAVAAMALELMKGAVSHPSHLIHQRRCCAFRSVPVVCCSAL